MIEQVVASVVPLIQQAHGLGYWIGFLAALLETALVVGLVLPGSTILLLLGAASAAGSLHFGALLAFAIAGAALGDNLNYWLGRRYGAQWTRSGVWFLTPSHFDTGRAFFERHGGKSVLLARFIPSIKEVAPFVAGSFGMRRGPFMLWNVLGAIGWGLQWVGGGYLFGRSLQVAQTWMTRAGFAVTAVVLLWIAVWLLRRFVIGRGAQIALVTRTLLRSASAALQRNRLVGDFVRLHPRVVAFAAARFSRRRFSGLPLTVLALAFVYVVALLAGLVEDVVTADRIVAFDAATAHVMAAIRFPELVRAFLWVTTLGEPTVIVAAAALAAWVLWRSDRRWQIAALALALGGATLTSALGKLAVQRPRPLGALLVETSYAFPSGHATTAVACYGMLAYLLARGPMSRGARVNLAIATVLLALAIGASRIVLGVHYLSDVWAGFLVGTLWLIGGVTLAEWLATTGRIDWTRRPRPARGPVAAWAALWVCGVALFAASRPLPELAAPAQRSVQLDRPLLAALTAAGLARTTTYFGDPGQPLNVAVVAGGADALARMLAAAGWAPADAPSLANLVRLAREGMGYARAPIAPAFWNTQVDALAFERVRTTSTGRVIETIRLWPTAYRLGRDSVFVGVARAYDGVRWGVLHTVRYDVDSVARGVAGSLVGAVPGFGACERPLMAPAAGQTLTGQRYFSSGRIWLAGPAAVIDGTSLCGASR